MNDIINCIRTLYNTTHFYFFEPQTHADSRRQKPLLFRDLRNNKMSGPSGRKTFPSRSDCTIYAVPALSEPYKYVCVHLCPSAVNIKFFFNYESHLKCTILKTDNLFLYLNQKELNCYKHIQTTSYICLI